MVFAYIPHIILLVISPILGMYTLRFVYPDVKTYITSKKWMLFVLFGFCAYVPAAAISLFELVKPIYSPFGSRPLFIESEANAVLMLFIMGTILVVNSSIVDFVLVKRKKNVMVGIPKHVIRYGIDQQIAKGKEEQKKKQIDRITKDIVTTLKDGGEEPGEDLTPLLDKIKISVEKERKEQNDAIRLARELQTAQPKAPVFIPETEPSGAPEIVQPSAPKVSEEKIVVEQPGAYEEIKTQVETLQKPARREVSGEEMVKGIISTDEYSKGLLARKPEPVLKPVPNAKARPKEIEELITEESEEARTKSNAELRKETIEALRESLKAKPCAEEPVQEVPEEKPKLTEKEALIAQLEEKLKKATRDSEKKDRVNQLLGELKDSIEEEKGENVVHGKYAEDDIKEIALSLREIKTEESGKEKGKHGEKVSKRTPEEDIGASLVSYEKAYSPKRREDDVFTAVVGDVRQQLVEPKGKATESTPKGGRWYEKGGGAEPAREPQFPADTGNVELFEQDLSLGDTGMGDLGEGFGDLGEGLEGDFGDLGELEGMNQDLESSGFDGMFVDMGAAKGGCPNCGKKGTSIVYCSSCGKPLCSNCAESVQGSEEFIKYKCPHCHEEFAMRRRMPAAQ